MVKSVYSFQGHKIAVNWLTLFNNNQLVNSLHQAEVIFDNSSLPLGFWTRTNSDGNYSGNNCRDWSSSSSSDNSTVYSFIFKSPEDGDTFLDNGTKMPCNQSRYFLCFKYKLECTPEKSPIIYLAFRCKSIQQGEELRLERVCLYDIKDAYTHYSGRDRLMI